MANEQRNQKPLKAGREKVLKIRDEQTANSPLMFLRVSGYDGLESKPNANSSWRPSVLEKQEASQLLRATGLTRDALQNRETEAESILLYGEDQVVYFIEHKVCLTHQVKQLWAG
jgi:hypothetical protein